jgi:hypothetical protein
MADVLGRYQDGLLMSLKDSRFFQMAPSALNRDVWDAIGSDVRAALLLEADFFVDKPIPPVLPDFYIAYSHKGEQSAFLEAYTARREALCALVLGCCAEASGKYLPEIVRMIWSICEESSWLMPSSNALSPGNASLPDITAPLIDISVTRTAADLSMAVQLLGSQLDQVSPILIKRIEYEIQRRVIEPFIAFDDFGWMLGPKSDAFACLSGCLMAAMTFERDDRQRWQCARRVWRLLDVLLSQLSPDGGIMSGLKSWQEIAGDVIDSLLMIYIATNGEIDARGEGLIHRLCRYPVNCHIARGWFVNPGERLMRPALYGIEVYRIGMAARDAYLCDLGAYLLRTGNQQVPRPNDYSLNRRVFEALHIEQILNEKLLQPLVHNIHLPEARQLLARVYEGEERGLALAIHGGDNGHMGSHLDVGDICLFAGGEPILIDIGNMGGTAYHNLPVINGIEQKYGADYHSADDSANWNDDYSMLSMSIAPAYPEESGIINWQRTVILTRDNSAQLIDVFDMREPSEVRFNFITPHKPSLSESHSQLGAVRIKWDAPLTAQVDELPLGGEAAPLWNNQVYRLSLCTPEPVAGGKYTFLFKEIKTYG